MAAPEEKHDFHISEPTYYRIKHSSSPALTAKLNDLQNTISVLASSQKQQEKMMSEAKLLKIMIYRRNPQLRREKSMQLLKRIQTCLKRTSRFGRLFTLIDDIQKDLQSTFGEVKKGGPVYLPAQQTWSYLLYLQLLYVKLLDTNASFCITAFQHLSCHFASGILIPQMVIFMGIVARIWLLSTSIREKIQTCYYPIYSLRQLIDRTNSDWKDPDLPPQLHPSIYEEVNTALRERLNTAGQLPAGESVETPQSIHVGIRKQQAVGVEKNTFLLHNQETEDIGVPVSVKRTVDHHSCDSAVNKKQKTETSDAKKKRKQKKIKSAESDTASVVSSQPNSDSALINTSTNKKTKRKRQMEKYISNEMQMKKKKCHLSDTVSTMGEVSFTTKVDYDVEHLHDMPVQSSADNVKSKKPRKKKKKLISDSHLFNHNNVVVDSNNVTTHKTYQKTKGKNKIIKTKRQANVLENAKRPHKHKVDRPKAEFRKEKRHF